MAQSGESPHDQYQTKTVTVQVDGIIQCHSLPTFRLRCKYHVNMANDEIYTPKWIFDDLAVEFDLDVAHPDRPTNVPTKKYLTQADDGLATDWHGLVWCNPPYSKPAPWVDKWLEHGNGLLLIPAAKSAWYNKLWQSRAIGITLPSNFKFQDMDGKPKSIHMPTQLWAVGKQATLALLRLNINVR